MLSPFALMLKTKFGKLESSGDEAVAAEESSSWREAGQHWKSQGGSRPEEWRLEVLVDVGAGLSAQKWKRRLTEIVSLSKYKYRAIGLEHTSSMT